MKTLIKALIGALLVVVGSLIATTDAWILGMALCGVGGWLIGEMAIEANR